MRSSAVLASVASLVFLAGCAEGVEGDTGAEPMGVWSSSGRRLLVVDSEGRSPFKVRVRRGRWKIYDPETMVRRAEVERFDDSWVVCDRTGAELARVARGSDGVEVELGPWGRLERVGERWALILASGQTAGYFAPESGAWSWRWAGVERGLRRVVESEDGRWEAREESRVVARATSGRPEASMMLAMSLDELEPELRVVLGLWLSEVSEASSSAEQPPISH